MNDRTVVDSPVDVPLFFHKLQPGGSRPDTAAQLNVSSAAQELSGMVPSAMPKEPRLHYPNFLAPPVEELENELFVLTRDYVLTLSGWNFTFVPLLCLHPLVSLYSVQPESVKQRIARKVAHFIELDPLIVAKYKWTLRVLEFLNKLCGKWRILEPRHLQHRTAALSTPCLVAYK